MKHRVLEIAKDVAIVLLLANILFLTISLLPGGIVGRLPSLPARSAASDSVIPAARPVLISGRAGGGRITAQRDFAALDGAWERWGGLLGQALQSAGLPGPETRRTFLDAMERPGVCFFFSGQIPMQALSRWLGGDREDLDDSADGYLLAVEDGAVALWTEGDRVNRYETDLSPDMLLSALEDQTPDGSRFFFEAFSGGRLDPLTVWTEETVSLPLAAWENPCDGAYATALASELAFNPYGAGAYTDPTGSRVFTEAGRTLSVGADGQVALRCGGEEFPAGIAAGSGAAARVETARALLDTVCGDVLGDARLYLTGYETEGETAVCRFGYVLGGVPVYPDGASVTFEENRVTELTAAVRTLRQTEKRQTLLPMNRAMAITTAGSRLTAGYYLSPDGSAAPLWHE